jgi:hypothetical protein
MTENQQERPLKRRIKSRKFLGSVAVFVTALTLLLTGQIDQGTWTTVTLTVYGAYAGANVAEKHVRSTQNAFSEPSATGKRQAEGT